MARIERPAVAVVGCGPWGRNHARVLHQLGARLTLCDSDASVLASLSERLPSAILTQDYEEVLADSTIEAVVLATPAASHAILAEKALLSNKDVLVEKPLALDPAAAVELVDLAEKGRRVLMVGHLLRYHPAILRLKELVETGVLGRISYLYSNRLNMGRVRQEENALWSFAPHDISVILHLLDALPVQVSATGGAYLQPAVADVSLSSLLFESGTRAHIFVSWLHPFKEQKLVVVGDRRMAVFDDSLQAEKLVLFEGSPELQNGVFVTHPPRRQPVPIEDEEPLLAEDRHFLDCIARRARPATDGAEGSRVLAVLEACQRSIQRNGEPVPLSILPVPERAS